MNIALLEDNLATIEWLTTALEIEGHTIYSFTHGPSLLKTLFNGPHVRSPLPYDLIICDLYLLGGRSSIDIITYIHQSIPLDQLSIIIISGATLSEIEYMQKRFPNYPVLRKPFSIKALQKLIKKMS